MLIKEMQIGDSGYTQSRAIDMYGGKPIINTHFEISPEVAGTRDLYVECTNDGYVATGWKETPRNTTAAISIYTRKYPWTYVDECDIADVIIKEG